VINLLAMLLLALWIGVANGLQIPRGFFLVLSVYCAGLVIYKVLAYFTREAAKAHARRILTTMPPEDEVPS